MAKYKTHLCINIFVFLPITAGLIYYFLSPRPLDWLCFIASYLYGTFFMGPDLDLIHQVRLFSLRGLFSLPFFGYSKVFKHRGISHQIFLGTTTRIVWLFGFILLSAGLILSLQEGYHYILQFGKTHKQELLYIIVALFSSDTAHILTDLAK